MRRAMLVLAVLALGAMVLAQEPSSSGNGSGSTGGSSGTTAASSGGSTSSGNAAGSSGGSGSSAESSSKSSASGQSSGRSGANSTSSNKKRQPTAKTASRPNTVIVRFAIVKGEWREVLTDNQGMTLYYNDQGKKGAPACKGSCTKDWKPLFLGDTAPRPTGESNITAYLDTLSRNGGKQVEVKGHPLYTFSKDQRPGQVRGASDLASKHWHAATPALLRYG